MLLSAFLFSCNDDFLDRPPLDKLTQDTFWESEKQMQEFSNSCYPYLVGKDIINIGEGLGDNAMWYQQTSWRQIGSGLYGSDFGDLNSTWEGYYAKIRGCNFFLENYQKTTSATEASRKKSAGEVRFIRAYIYYYLTCFFGDVPLILKVLSTDSPEIFMARTPRAEVVDFILKEMDEIAENLPKNIAPATTSFGRISATAAIAFKARVALQFEKWEVAQKACERLMPGGDLAYHELYSTGQPKQDYFDLFTFVGRASRVNKNKETILAYVYNYDLAANSRTYHNLSRELMVPDQIIRFNPTKSLVDSYLCDDGLPIERSPRYKGNGTYTPAYSAYDSIFVNRDPRLKQSIVYPGYNKWYGKADGRSGEQPAPNDIFLSPKFNNDKKGAVTYTGYYSRKYCEPNKVPTYNRDDNDIIILRYGDVLLMYAESMFKQGKLTQSEVDKTINLLRNRVGMSRMVLTELADHGLNVETELRRERRVETFLEGQRWFDIIRWKEGYRLGVDKTETTEKQEIGVVKGIRKDYAYDQTQLAGRKFDKDGFLIYDDTRTFEAPKNYLMSLPYTQMQRNSNLKPNNPGWE